jgi:hypothetical protein
MMKRLKDKLAEDYGRVRSQERNAAIQKIDECFEALLGIIDNSTRSSLHNQIKKSVEAMGVPNVDVEVYTGELLEFTFVVRVTGRVDPCAVFVFVREGKQSPEAEWNLVEQPPRLKVHGNLPSLP